MKLELTTCLMGMLIVGCFPSFAPTEEIVEECRDGEVYAKWVKLRGILDQEFPDYISLQRGKHIDTICQSTNIADIKMYSDKLEVGFYGKPKKYDEPISLPEKIKGYRIIVDTSFVKTE